MRRQAPRYLALLVVVLLVGACGGAAGPAEDASQKDATATTKQRSSVVKRAPTAVSNGSKLTVITPPVGEVSSDASSFYVTGTSAFSRVVVTNVGGPNDGSHPDAGDDGYPEYRTKVRADGTWSQQIPIFRGENSIFVEAVGDDDSSLTRVITGTGNATPGSFKLSTPARRRSKRPQELAFSGNGGKNLGTLSIPNDATLTWTSDGDLFQVSANEPGLFVNSQGERGTSEVGAGRYTAVNINAIGDWTVRIR